MTVNQIKNQPGAITPGGAKGAGETVKSERVATAKQAASSYAKNAVPPTVSDAANVQISPKARELSQARKIVDETPDVREDKVADFRARIAKGEYKPEASKIADGILSEALKDELSKHPESTYE